MIETLQRMPTGIPGLDRVLKGGLMAGGSYILQGRPGSGKTILANQIAFAQVARGHSVLYVTLLAESHDRLFQNLATLSFFDRSRIGAGIDYISAFQTMQDEGLPGVVKLLGREITRKGSTLFILDGLLNAREKAETSLDVKTFVVELQGYAAFAGCTTVFLTSARLHDASPEHTMVDGVIDLNDETVGVRAVRSMEVRKSRGSAALRGIHQFEIGDGGLIVHPRLEALYAYPSAVAEPGEGRVTSGIADLDVMSGGGFPEGSFSLVIGPSGSGKTMLGLHFLGEATPQEKALHFGFYETPDRLVRKARAAGIDLARLVAAGALHILWQPLTENLLDELGHRLLEAVERHGIRRLFIDGFGGFKRAAIRSERMVEFFAAVSNELRTRGVTTVATWEMRDLLGSDVQAPAPEISSIVDNLFLMRFEGRERLARVMSILKLRDSMFDPSLREFTIGDKGVVLVRNRASGPGLVQGEGPGLEV